VRPAGIGDPPVAGRLPAGLADPRVEPEVGHQPFGSAEPGEVTDRRHDRQRDRGVHAGDGHQPQHFRPGEGGLAQVLVDQGQLLSVEVELAQQRRRCGPSLVRPADLGASLDGAAARGDTVREERPHISN
jgi:hypothetical protein